MMDTPRVQQQNKLFQGGPLDADWDFAKVLHI